MRVVERDVEGRGWIDVEGRGKRCEIERRGGEDRDREVNRGRRD